MNLYFIRHGRQDSPLCNVNVPLAKEGEAQARLLGTRLAGYGIDALYSSDLIRAVQTARIVNEQLGLEHEIREGLREISFGALEGNTNEYNRIHFSEFLRELDELREDLPYPEGENGEDVCVRMYPVLEEIIQSGRNNVAIVTHGNSIRSILTKLLGIATAKKLLFANNFENCSITQVKYVPEKDRFYLERLNDYAHIEAHPELLRTNWL